MNICNDPDILSIFYIANILIDIALIVAPIILIIMLIIDIVKTISGDIDKVKNLKKSFTYRLIAIVIIILVPVIVDFGLSIMDSPDTVNYIDCLTNAELDKIEELRQEQAFEALETYLAEPTKYNYDIAYGLISKIGEDGVREDFESQLGTQP